MIPRPQPGDYPDYFSRYLIHVPESNIEMLLASQTDSLARLAQKVSDENYRYSAGKWTIKEVFGHITDTERVFSYRSLRFSRRDATPLPGFDQDRFVENGNFDARALHDIVQEFVLLRQSNLLLFRGVIEANWNFIGIASDKQIKLNVLPYIMVGHVIHHQQILAERYGIID